MWGMWKGLVVYLIFGPFSWQSQRQTAKTKPPECALILKDTHGFVSMPMSPNTPAKARGGFV